jgi:hypothetical protein
MLGVDGWGPFPGWCHRGGLEVGLIRVKNLVVVSQLM